MPWLRPGLSLCAGVAPLTTHFAETGEPLITAAEAAADLRRQGRHESHVWVNRKRLEPVGLDEDGLQLFGATDVVKLIPARVA